MMADTIDIGMKYARQRIVSGLLGAAIVAGCLVIAAPAFADTDAEQMQIKDMQNKLNTVQNELAQITSGMAARSDSGAGLPLHGFLDIGYASNNYEDVAVKLHGFNVGTLDFYLTPQFSDNVKSLVELVFEVDAHGVMSPDFERAQIGYTLSDNMTLWGGRFHTPYGYWNTAFHSGAQIQTSILRPRFLAFGDRGGVLPSHMVGLWATGKTGAGQGKITYDAFAGNGPKLVGVTGSGMADGSIDPNMAGDNNHNVMAGLNVGYEFSGSLDGLRLAAHGFKGTVDSYLTDAGPVIDSTDLNMLGGSAVYLADDWEVMSEYYHFSDKNKISNIGTHKSWASYLQVGKELNRITPFVRFEKAVLNQMDNYFGDQETGRAYSRESVGLSYSLNQKAALKFELLNSKFEADTARGTGSFNTILAQYAIRF